MNITLHIDRLILAGLPLEQRDVPALQAAAERELARLLTTYGSTAQFNAGGSLASVKGGSIQLRQHIDPSELGTHIATAAFIGVGGEH